MTYSRDRFKAGDKVRCTLTIEGEVEDTPYLGDIIGLRISNGRYRTVRLGDITDVEWNYPPPDYWPPQVGDLWRLDTDTKTYALYCYRSSADSLLYWKYPDGSTLKVARSWESRSKKEYKWRLITRGEEE